jgi:hypothetical protein
LLSILFSISFTMSVSDEDYTSEAGRDYWYLDWYCFCNLKKKSKYTYVIDKICY